MSLRPLQAQYPLGQFDGLDNQVLSLKGGEIVTFGSTAVPPGDKAAADVFDGYINPSSRSVVKLLSATSDRPLMLADEGITGYGTLFGSVVGGTAGQQSTGGAALGPHTATGSGKVTCWAQPGLFAVSLDAVAADLQPSAGVIAGGAALYGTTTTGLITADGSGSKPVIGRFVEFNTNGSLVTTPNSLVGTFNPPDGTLSATAKVPTFVTIWFAPVVS